MQLEAGHLAFAAFGTVYHLSVRPAPWQPHAGVALLPEHPGGDVEILPPEDGWVTRAYIGSVEGIEDSAALFVVTAPGVAGFVRTPDVAIEFEPVVFLAPEAPHGISVAYRPNDVVAWWDLKHGGPLLTHQDVSPLNASVQFSAVRAMTIWADNEMTDTPNWNSRMTNAFNRLNTEYSLHMSFSFSLVNGVSYVCHSQSCNVAWGMTSTDSTMLPYEWGNKIRQWSTINGFEIGTCSRGRRYTMAMGTRSEELDGSPGAMHSPKVKVRRSCN